MRILAVFILMVAAICCNDENRFSQIPRKVERNNYTKELVGIWELLKVSHSPSEEPSLVSASSKEYFEIKGDGNCEDDGRVAKWFLSYTDDYIVDSTSNIYFNKISNLEVKYWNSYDRNLSTYQIKMVTEKNIKYLYMTSLRTLGTKIYLRKN